MLPMRGTQILLLDGLEIGQLLPVRTCFPIVRIPLQENVLAAPAVRVIRKTAGVVIVLMMAVRLVGPE